VDALPYHSNPSPPLRLLDHFTGVRLDLQVAP